MYKFNNDPSINHFIRPMRLLFLLHHRPPSTFDPIFLIFWWTHWCDVRPFNWTNPHAQTTQRKKQIRMPNTQLTKTCNVHGNEQNDVIDCSAINYELHNAILCALDHWTGRKQKRPIMCCNPVPSHDILPPRAPRTSPHRSVVPFVHPSIEWRSRSTRAHNIHDMQPRTGQCLSPPSRTAPQPQLQPYVPSKPKRPMCVCVH